MAVTLDAPISWMNATGDNAKMLDDLQPNILRAHARDYLTVLFVRFGTAAAGRTFLRSVAKPPAGGPLMKSARKHLQEIAQFNANGTPGTAYVGVGITSVGYTALGIPAAKQPADPSFRAGMRSNGTRQKLQDPPMASLEAGFRGQIHAVVLVGDSFKASADAALARVRSMLTANVEVVGEQEGRGLHNASGDGIEHFGYVDGRSQPLFLEEDVIRETLRGDGTSVWDPAFGAERVIVSDPAAPKPATQFGSYFVYRKLEQNVQLFKQQEEALADRLGLTGADEERAGAMMVGRYEDGTPLTSQRSDGFHHPVPNDFDYDSDTDGGKCPFFAHIRKVNPRGSGGFESVDDERLHIMARRGQTYGTRVDNPNDGVTDNKPKRDVGLLFMAFNANIGQQFEFAQSTWANFSGFPQTPPGAAPGLDLVIGQGTRPNISCPLDWGADRTKAAQNGTTTAPPQTVTMLGGEYFFMPSLAFLKALPA